VAILLLLIQNWRLIFSVCFSVSFTNLQRMYLYL